MSSFYLELPLSSVSFLLYGLIGKRERQTEEKGSRATGSFSLQDDKFSFFFLSMSEWSSRSIGRAYPLLDNSVLSTTFFALRTVLIRLKREEFRESDQWQAATWNSSPSTLRRELIGIFVIFEEEPVPFSHPTSLRSGGMTGKRIRPTG